MFSRIRHTLDLLHYKRAAKSHFRSLEQNHFANIRDYSHEGYFYLNRHLRSERPLLENQSRLHTSLHSNSIRLTRPITIFRGTTMPKSLLISGEWKDPAWASASIDPRVAEDFIYGEQPNNLTETAESCMLVLHVSVGCSVVPMEQALNKLRNNRYSEKEILLVPNMHWRVMSKDYYDGHEHTVPLYHISVTVPACD